MATQAQSPSITLTQDAHPQHIAKHYQDLVGPPPQQLDASPVTQPVQPPLHIQIEADTNLSTSSDSSSDEIEFSDSLSVRELQKSLREIDAESIIAPVISHTQSNALYAAAASPSHSRRPSTSTSSSDDEASPSVAGLRPIPEKENTQKHAPAPNVPRLSSGPGPRKLQRSVSHKKPQHRPQFPFSLSALQLPSLPLVSLPSFVTGSSSSGTDKSKRRRAKTLTFPKPSSGSFFSPKSPVFFGGKHVEEEPVSTFQSRPPVLRRASSVSSMPQAKPNLSRTVSAASSLGDDNKYHHVHSQTNSRFKAIRDNLLDTLPQLQLPNLHQQLASLNPFTDPSTPTTSTTNLKDTNRSPALEAIDGIVGDVVVMGGYRGSILRDKTANNRRVWIPLKVGFNLRKVDLEVGLEPEDEERMAEKIWADGMLTHIGPVDIGRRLIRRLRHGADENGRRVHDWGYDWRLSPALLSKRLIAFLETLPCNKRWLGESRDVKRKGKGALVIAHSLGGLVVRHAMNLRPDLFSGVLFAGTPQTCVNILGPLRNGDAVLFNSKVFTAQVSFTLRSSFAFLPEDGQCFFDRRTGKPIPLDFFDVNTWKEYALSPCVAPSIVQPPTIKLTSPSSVLYTLRERIDTNSLSAPSNPESSDLHSPTDRTIAPQMSNAPTGAGEQTVTLPLSKTIPYLERTLRETLEFKKELHYKPHMEKAYPPMAVIYSKTTPTCRGARVDGVEGVRKADAYDDLAFGAGDGVCLARAAMLPSGYKCAKKVAVDRGHVSLLGDLEGVGRCIQALLAERGW